METKEMNTCLMLAVNLDCPVNLKAVFEDDDLKDTGVELDSHITLLYAQGKKLDRKEMMEDIRFILGDEEFQEFLGKMKEGKEIPVLDVFDLDCFENDSDYIILKLKKECGIYSWLNQINKSLRIKYDVASDFADYTPHVSLAELQPGTASKYLESETLKLVLQDTVISLEDIMISYGLSNEPDDRKQYFLTAFHSVDRYFRLLHLRAE